MPPWSALRLAPALSVRGLALAGSAVASLPLAGAPAAAQEPLFLRIRPQDAPPPAIGTGRADAEVAAARAAREAVWQRSTERANIAIASVCTGCLGRPPAPPPLRPERPRPATPPEGAQTAPASADPSAAPSPDAVAGLAGDPPSTRGDP